MNTFENSVNDARDLFRVSGWFGSSCLSFRFEDREQINLFVEALQAVSGLENITISDPNLYGFVSVWCDPKTAVSYAIYRAICEAFTNN